MANTTFNIPRAHITMALCLPLAVLLGYVLAEPLESGSVAVVVFVLVILSVPLFMKWHHPLLVLSWNAAVNPVFLPGRAALWLFLSGVSLFFAVINRATNPDEKFVSAPAITKALAAMVIVVVGTGLAAGGFGSRLLGSSQYGGGKYIYLLGAILGYFALTSRRIPVHRAEFYTGLFFLSGLSAGIANLAFVAGPSMYFLYMLFSPGYASAQATAANSLDSDMMRLGTMQMISPALYCWAFARYGIQGLFDLSRPWRMLLMVIAVVAGLFGGFRSTAILFALTFAFLFFFQGLHRTKYVLLVGAFVLLAGISLVPCANKLPLQVQRCLTVLPLKLDPQARLSAEVSSDWRKDMWKVAMLDVPKYFFRGKGYTIDSRDVGETEFFTKSIYNESWAGALLMGDYHNGPLSIIIPLGIYGCVAFLWFLFVSHRLMWRYLKEGPPSLRKINGLLLATFAAKTVMFFLVFGALCTDMAMFTGLIGLSVALNGGQVAAKEPEVTSISELEPNLNEGLSIS